MHNISSINISFFIWTTLYNKFENLYEVDEFLEKYNL